MLTQTSDSSSPMESSRPRRSLQLEEPVHPSNRTVDSYNDRSNIYASGQLTEKHDRKIPNEKGEGNSQTNPMIHDAFQSASSDITYVHSPISAEQLQDATSCAPAASQQPESASSYVFNAILSSIPEEHIMTYILQALQSKEIDRRKNDLGKEEPKDVHNAILRTNDMFSSSPACNENDDDETQSPIDVPIDEDCKGIDQETEFFYSQTDDDDLILTSEQLAGKLNSMRKNSPKKKTIFSMVLPTAATKSQMEKKVPINDPVKSIGGKLRKNRKAVKGYPSIHKSNDNGESETEDEICESKKSLQEGWVSEITVGPDTLVFYSLPNSIGYMTRIRLKNEQSYFLGYKIYCNHTALVNFSVSSTTGVIPPGDTVYVAIKTKKSRDNHALNEIIIRESTFTVKMFHMITGDMDDFTECYRTLSRELPHLISSRTFEKNILYSPEKFPSVEAALDSIKNCLEDSSLKYYLHKRSSTTIPRGNDHFTMKNSQAEIMKTNRKMTFFSENLVRWGNLKDISIVAISGIIAVTCIFGCKFIIGTVPNLVDLLLLRISHEG